LDWLFDFLCSDLKESLKESADKLTKYESAEQRQEVDPNKLEVQDDFPVKVVDTVLPQFTFWRHSV